MKEITYKELEKIVQKQPAAFLCGNGFSINFSELRNLYNLKLDEIRSFLDKYKILMTLNYDHILENMSSRPVQHIHG